MKCIKEKMRCSAVSLFYPLKYVMWYIHIIQVLMKYMYTITLNIFKKIRNICIHLAHGLKGIRDFVRILKTSRDTTQGSDQRHQSFF